MADIEQVRFETIPTPLADRWRDFTRGPLAILVWLGAGLGALFLASTAAGKTSFVGLVDGLRADLTFGRSGTLAAVLVDLHERVRRGQVLALLDDSGFEAQLLTARAEGLALQAEVQVATSVAEREATARDLARLLEERSLGDETITIVGEWRADRRAFVQDVLELELRALALEVDLEDDRRLEQSITAQVERTRSLGAQGVHPLARGVDLELERTRVRSRIGSNETLLAETRARVDEARTRSATHEAERPAVGDGEVLAEAFLALEEAALVAGRVSLDALRARVAVQAARIGELAIARTSLALRSPLDGYVVRIDACASQVLLTDQVVLGLVSLESSGATIWIPEGRAGDLLVVGDRVSMARPWAGRAPDSAHEVLVVSLAPEVGPLPARLWGHPTRPEHGRAALVGPIPEGFLPGERIELRRETAVRRLLNALDPFGG